ncbi:MAG: SDR family NAD(P)-dependent oxidoreductase, partial [Planctomycetes bacterium]|nr:SDR family NAD(P)-dependent oxidoreductase [Planctomycetota bacterium]
MSASTPKSPVALVTGASSGIGRATALAFARQGYDLLLAARRTEAGESLVREIRSLGREALFVRTDVSKEAEVAALVERGLAKFGRLDAAFNNAGVEGPTFIGLEQHDHASYTEVFEINVFGVLCSMKHEIPALLASGGGAIVNTASVAGLIGFPGMSVYTASKHAVVG